MIETQQARELLRRRDVRGLAEMAGYRQEPAFTGLIEGLHQKDPNRVKSAIGEMEEGDGRDVEMFLVLNGIPNLQPDRMLEQDRQELFEATSPTNRDKYLKSGVTKFGEFSPYFPTGDLWRARSTDIFIVANHRGAEFPSLQGGVRSVYNYLDNLYWNNYMTALGNRSKLTRFTNRRALTFRVARWLAGAAAVGGTFLAAYAAIDNVVSPAYFDVAVLGVASYIALKAPIKVYNLGMLASRIERAGVAKQLYRQITQASEGRVALPA